VFVQAQLGLGQTLLVHSIGSGIGTAALQLGLCAGAQVLGSSRTQDKLERCASLGLQHGLLVDDKTFAQAVATHTHGRGCDVILDTVGGSYLAENVKALATLGRLVIIGLMGGAAAELPLGLLLAKRAQVIGTVLRSRSLEEKATLCQRFARDVVPLFERGQLKPVIDAVLPMSEIRQAHARMERNSSFGKLVMSWE
jgi:NADPH:quinone reductase